VRERSSGTAGFRGVVVRGGTWWSIVCKRAVASRFRPVWRAGANARGRGGERDASRRPGRPRLGLVPPSRIGRGRDLAANPWGRQRHRRPPRVPFVATTTLVSVTVSVVVTVVARARPRRRSSA
jgi:hypothetical protein